MPLPDRNPKRRCQTALISRSQPITTATPIDDASGTAIARKPQISIRMPQIVSGLPAPAADVESFIAFLLLIARDPVDQSIYKTTAASVTAPVPFCKPNQLARIPRIRLIGNFGFDQFGE